MGWYHAVARTSRFSLALGKIQCSQGSLLFCWNWSAMSDKTLGEMVWLVLARAYLQDPPHYRLGHVGR